MYGKRWLHGDTRRCASPADVTAGRATPFLAVDRRAEPPAILALLAHGERCVCDIEAALALPQNLVSHHLAALRRGGLLSDRRAGRWVYYRLAPDIVQDGVRELTILLGAEGAATPALPCAPNERG
ncbi:MAG TPA: metalloregulator ArsR/SmtB family transcription factor [Chloroflexota bacterium]|nr:metalloregulator ArsR/SmtB family transcription factor [Chloroflexota bacterium]